MKRSFIMINYYILLLSWFWLCSDDERPKSRERFSLFFPTKTKQNKTKIRGKIREERDVYVIIINIISKGT